MFKIRTDMLTSCVHCGVSMEIPAYRIALKNFCSNNCRLEHSRAHVFCGHCNRPLSVAKSNLKPKNFCDNVCRAEYGRAYVYCDTCGKIFHKPKSAVKRYNYCGKQCQDASTQRKNNFINLNICLK